MCEILSLVLDAFSSNLTLSSSVSNFFSHHSGMTFNSTDRAALSEVMQQRLLLTVLLSVTYGRRANYCWGRCTPMRLTAIEMRF